MFFRKDQDLQRLNLEPPKPNPAAPASPAVTVDPAKMELVHKRAKEILDSGALPQLMFLCGLPNGLLTFVPGPGEKPVVLLFSTPFAATDYLRAAKAAAEVRQFRVDALPQMAQSWLASGAAAVAIDRCPRCPQFLTCPLTGFLQNTPVDFAKIWAYHRASRIVLGGIRVQSAMHHMASGNHAAARTDLEYIRDHFDCAVPYVHQAIALLSGALQDEPGKAAAEERLKEFGPQFAGPVEFSPQVMATVMVGLTGTFGVLNVPATSRKSAQP